MKRILRLGGIISVLTTAVILGLFQLPTNNEQSIRIEITPGDTLSGLSRQWQQDGWLPSALLLRIQARLSGQSRILRPGEYDIPAALTGGQLLDYLASASPVAYRVTLIEGHDLREALTAISSAPKLIQDIQPLTPETVAAFLQLNTAAEGQLYPDTYVYHSGDKASVVIQQAHQRLQEQLQQAWQQRASDLPYNAPYEALIMASIVEKETGAAEERPMIAGVFVRRLQKNMRLETDPTVIYGLGPDFDGNLRRKHLQDRSNPYNTYRHKGLPPGPIALAGRAAMDAALNPEDGDALYFVAKGDGSHQFSATLEEHSAAVRRYQIYRRTKDYRSAPAPQPTNEEQQPTL